MRGARKQGVDVEKERVIDLAGMSITETSLDTPDIHRLLLSSNKGKWKDDRPTIQRIKRATKFRMKELNGLFSKSRRWF